MRKKRDSGRFGLSIRVDLGPSLQLGPGKVALLEAIGQCGSISAAGRTLGMSYRRAWDLVETLNRGCAEPVVCAAPGGKDGGGTTLTAAGEALIGHYRRIERASAEAARPEIAALCRMLPAG